MAYVSGSYDGVTRPKLATKGDIDILKSHAAASEVVVNLAEKYKTVKLQREAEAKRLYPNRSFIERCDKIMARLLPAYQQVYGG